MTDGRTRIKDRVQHLLLAILLPYAGQIGPDIPTLSLNAMTIRALGDIGAIEQSSSSLWIPDHGQERLCRRERATLSGRLLREVLGRQKPYIFVRTPVETLCHQRFQVGREVARLDHIEQHQRTRF